MSCTFPDSNLHPQKSEKLRKPITVVGLEYSRHVLFPLSSSSFLERLGKLSGTEKSWNKREMLVVFEAGGGESIENRGWVRVFAKMANNSRLFSLLFMSLHSALIF